MKRSPGRPPLDYDDRSVQVGVSLPSKQFDELSKRALREGVSLPTIIRQDLKQQLKSKK